MNELPHVELTLNKWNPSSGVFPPRKPSAKCYSFFKRHPIPIGKTSTPLVCTPLTMGDGSIITCVCGEAYTWHPYDFYLFPKDTAAIGVGRAAAEEDQQLLEGCDDGHEEHCPHDDHGSRASQDDAQEQDEG